MEDKLCMFDGIVKVVFFLLSLFEPSAKYHTHPVGSVVSVRIDCLHLQHHPQLLVQVGDYSYGNEL